MADIVGMYYEEAQRAYAENLKRYQEARGIIEDLITQYSVGQYYGAGGAGEVQKGLLEETKARDVASVKAGYYGAGLGGTTLAYNAPYAWEKQVGTPARAKLETTRLSTQEQYRMALQNLVTSIETPYPDYGALMQAVVAQQSIPSQTYSAWDVTSLPGRTSAKTTPAYSTPTAYSTATTQTAPTQTSATRYAPEVGYGISAAPVATTPVSGGGEWREVSYSDINTGKQYKKFYSGNTLISTVEV